MDYTILRSPLTANIHNMRAHTHSNITFFLHGVCNDKSLKHRSSCYGYRAHMRTETQSQKMQQWSHTRTYGMTQWMYKSLAWFTYAEPSVAPKGNNNNNSVNKNHRLYCLSCKCKWYSVSIYTTSNEHAESIKRKLVPAERHQFHTQVKTQNKLNFQVQQVAFDLVVDVGVIFLLAQVQAWDVHSRLSKKKHLLFSRLLFLRQMSQIDALWRP